METTREKRNSKKRKRSSLIAVDKDDHAPPDKQQHMLNPTRSKSTVNDTGKAATPKKGNDRELIGLKVKVEYQEQNSGRTSMDYMGWFEGTVVSYNRRKGYFVQFHDQDINGKKIPSWSDWLEDLYTDDVVIL